MSGGVWYAEPVAYRGTREPWQHACGEVTYFDKAFDPTDTATECGACDETDIEWSRSRLYTLRRSAGEPLETGTLVLLELDGRERTTVVVERTGPLGGTEMISIRPKGSAGISLVTREL